MKLLGKLVLFLLLLIIVSSCQSVKGLAAEDLEYDYFKVEILQDGKSLDFYDNMVEAYKYPFVIKITMKEEMMIYINISGNNRAYQMAESNQDFAKLLEVDGRWMGGAEYRDNKNNSFVLQINEERWQNWYYYDEENSRFDMIERVGDEIICYRTIEAWNDSDYRGLYPIDELSAETLYLVATRVEHDDNYENFVEEETQFFKITFK